MNILVNDIKLDPVTYAYNIRFEGSIPLETLQDGEYMGKDFYAVIGEWFVNAIKKSRSVTEEEIYD